MLSLNDLGNMLLKAGNQNTIRLSCPCSFSALTKSVKSILESYDVDLSTIDGAFRFYDDKDNLIVFLYGKLNKEFKMIHDCVMGLNIFIISYDRLLVIENSVDLIKGMKNIFRLILFENGIQYHNINIVNDPEIIDLFHKHLPDRVLLEAIYSVWCLTENNTLLEDCLFDKFEYSDLLQTMKIIKENNKIDSPYFDEE